MRPAKTQISLIRIFTARLVSWACSGCPGWSESLLGTHVIWFFFFSYCGSDENERTHSTDPVPASNYRPYIHFDIVKMSRDMTKPPKWVSKTQVMGISVWSEYSLCSQLAKDPSLHADSETCRLGMPRLIWVFAGRTLILLVLSCRGSNMAFQRNMY